MSRISDSDRFFDAAIARGIEMSGCCRLDGILHDDSPVDDDLREVLQESGSGRALNGALANIKSAGESAESTWQV